MSTKTRPEATWISGWCGEGKADWQHRECRGGYDNAMSGERVPCACPCHDPEEEDEPLFGIEQVNPDAWRPIFDAWLAEEVDVLDFRGCPVPERLQLLLELLDL